MYCSSAPREDDFKALVNFSIRPFASSFLVRAETVASRARYGVRTCRVDRSGRSPT